MQLAFRGRPSKGCSKCRQRKVKCDEGHPSCERCMKGGFDCVYRDEFDLLLRNQTSQTAAKAQKKWRSRAKKSDQPPASASVSASSPSSGSNSDSPREKPVQLAMNHTPTVSLDQTIYDLAAKRFIFDFVIPKGPIAPRRGFVSFLPEMIPDMQAGTDIYHAFRATSLANFAARSKSVQTAGMASKEYGMAIKILGPKIADLGSSSPLETLSAVCFLGFYEILSTPYLTHSGSWQAHVNGSCAILNVLFTRGHSDLEPLNEIFLHIVTQMLINRITAGKAPAIPLAMVDSFLNPKTVPGQIMHLMYKAADCLAEWREVETKILDPYLLLPAATKMVDDCDRVDADMCQWLDERAPVWEEEIRPNNPASLPDWLQPLFTLPGAPSKLRVGSTILIAQRHLLARGTRIQTHIHALNAVDILISCAQTDEELARWLETQQRFEARVMTVIDDMLSGIYGGMTLPIRGKPAPTCLDDVPTLRAIVMLWPLYRAGMLMARRESMALLDTEGRASWCRSVLCWFRDELGLKKCEAFVDNIDGKLGLTFL